MKNTSGASRVRPSGLLSVAIASALFALAGCSGEPATDDGTSGAGGTSGTASGAAGTSGTAGSMTTGGAGAGGSAMGGAGAGGTSGSAGSSGGAGAGGAGTAGGGGSTGGSAGAGNAGMAGVAGNMGGAAGAGAGGAGAGGGGAGGASGAGMSGAAGGGGTSADDFDPQPEDFTCIADWEKVLGFRITNALGKTAEAIAVAESGTGTYPVGTILQHLPTEAMVKRRAGFSPETKDWEFFLLQLSPQGVTTIAERGTTEIETSMGATCVSCHSLAPDEFDFVCNTWGDEGGDNCGFDFMDSFLDQQLESDTRCE